MFKVPEQLRVKTGRLASDASYGNNGLFFVPHVLGKPPLRVIASDGEGWEHVSVSLPDRTPTWAEMCHVQALFWDASDTVMQLHAPRAEWVNNHRFCLHLWRPIGQEIPRPPQLLVGDQSLGVLR